MNKKTQKTYAEVYQSFCEGVEKIAVQRLGRGLTGDEVKVIRNAGSGLILESLEQDIIHAESPDKVVSIFRTSANVSRYGSYSENLKQKCREILGRDLVKGEVAQISELPSVVEIFFILEKLQDSKVVSQIKAQKSLVLLFQ